MGRPKKERLERPYGTRAVVYLRVSGQKQVDEGHGLDAQRDACLDYVSSHKYSVVETLSDEAISGTKGIDERAGLNRALALCDAGQADVFLSYALDRQGRDVVLFNEVRARLRRAGVRFETAKEAQDFTRDESFLMGDIYAAFAAEERRRITARMYGGRRQRSKKDGLGSGPLPFGYTRVGERIAIDAQAALVIRRLLSLRGQGMTYQATADMLTMEGYKPAKGDKWTVGHVLNIERNAELYRTGTRKWDGVVASEQWPVIVTEQKTLV